MFICGGVSVLPFRDSCFDTMLLIAVPHHIPSEKERILTIKEIHRVLKKEGMLFLSVWSGNALKFRQANRGSLEKNTGACRVVSECL